jgi:hypothetical protein
MRHKGRRGNDFQPVQLAWLVERRLNIWLWCEACSHQASLATPPILARFGDLNLTALGRRFRCSNCQSRDIFIRPDWHGAGWSRGVVSRHESLDE